MAHVAELEDMAMPDTFRTRPELTATEARAGRIVKGGAIRRILWVSLILAAVAMAIAYFVVF